MSGRVGLQPDESSSGRTDERAERPRDKPVKAVLPPALDLKRPHDIISMQRLIGNAAVVQLLRDGQQGSRPDDRSAVQDVIGHGGRPLDASTRQMMESRIGHDFSDVRIHTGRAASESARSLGATAYTVGNNIVFGDGVSSGATAQRTLAHELTHVVQQRRGPVDGTDIGGGIRVSSPSDRFERQAEMTADAVMSGRLVPADETGSSSRARDVTVQRHSSWEHSLLGDAKPDVLAKMGTWQDLIKQTEREGALIGPGKLAISPNNQTKFGTPKQQTAMVTIDGVGDIDKGQVMHVLVQEMSRLSEWQKSPPTKATSDDVYDKNEKDPDFEVVTVRLPSASGPSLLVTYGELNTLADFYGSLELMKEAAPKQRLQIVQSVRKETFLRLKEIYQHLTNSLTKTESKTDDVKAAKEQYKDDKLDKTAFKGAAAPDFISAKKGQADLLAGDKPIIGQGTGAGGGINEYGASLARNACHFVPESWHAWAGYHEKARARAADSQAALTKARAKKADMRQEDYSRRPLDLSDAQSELALLEHKVSTAANDALLNNGFGDHYLQDSYAAGHMINKTQIMQWYVEFIDSSSEWDYFKDKNWRRVQQMAYGQGGLSDPAQYDKDKIQGSDPTDAHPNMPRNPQSVENIGGDDWMVRFTALGLKVPASLRTPGSDERKVVEWWQLETAPKGVWESFKRGVKGGARKKSGKELRSGLKAAGIMIGQAELEAALVNLIVDGIVRTGEENETRGKYMKSGSQQKFTNFATATLLLREDYVPKKVAKMAQAQALSKTGDDSEYQKMAASVTYGDYMEFMESGFIQKATNALHDVFCAKGLTVMTGAGAEAFKVYGDDAMFNSESSKGVKESGMTANMSRDAILSIINTGADGGKSTKSILDRLPSRVEFEVGGNVVDEPIETWHNSKNPGYLKDVSMKTIFPKMSWDIMQKFVPGVIGSSLGQISKDKKVHGGDAF